MAATAAELDCVLCCTHCRTCSALPYERNEATKWRKNREFRSKLKNTILNNKIQHVARMGIKTEHQLELVNNVVAKCSRFIY